MVNKQYSPFKKEEGEKRATKTNAEFKQYLLNDGEGNGNGGLGILYIDGEKVTISIRN